MSPIPLSNLHRATYVRRGAPQEPLAHSRAVADLGQYYQSEYLVPSRAVACDFVCTSKTFFPPQFVESGSSWMAWSAQSDWPVMGSVGIRRRKRIFVSVPAPMFTPLTRASRSGG